MKLIIKNIRERRLILILPIVFLITAAMLAACSQAATTTSSDQNTGADTSSSTSAGTQISPGSGAGEDLSQSQGAADDSSQDQVSDSRPPSMPGSGQPQNRGTVGTVENIDANTLTLSAAQGQLTVNISSDTIIRKIAEVNIEDLQPGLFLTVMGTRNLMTRFPHIHND